MNRVILSTLMIFSFLILSTDLKAEERDNGSKRVKDALEKLAEKCGNQDSKSVYISRNRDTGFLDEKYMISPFACKKGNKQLRAAIKALESESETGFDYSYVGSEQDGVFEISVGGQIIPLRKKNQNMWMISFKNDKDPRLYDVYSLALTDNKDGQINGTVSLITVRRSNVLKKDNSVNTSKDIKKGKKKFVLEGYVDPYIADSCYNIYIGNVNDEITDADLVDRVLVKDKKFHYEIDLDEIKSGRIRAIFPGNNLCSAWVNLYFVPDFTLKVSIHNGFYNIKNRYAYEAKVNEAMNEYHQQLNDPVPAVSTNKVTKVVIKENKEATTPDEEAEKFKASFVAYEKLFYQIRDQMSTINSMTGVTVTFIMEQLKIISAQIERVTNGMRVMIDKYSSTISEINNAFIDTF